MSCGNDQSHKKKKIFRVKIVVPTEEEKKGRTMERQKEKICTTRDRRRH